MAKTKQDPTGQAKNRKRATRALDRRLVRARRRILRAFRAIPRTRTTRAVIPNAETTTVYTYDINAQGFAELNALIEFINNDELLETQTGVRPFDWYYAPRVEQPFRQGAIDGVNGFNQAVVTAIAAGAAINLLSTPKLDPAQILGSVEYREGLSEAITNNFETVSGSLSERTTSQVYQEVRNGITSGLPPSEISANISERYNVAMSNAKRIADTETNRAYNDAKMGSLDNAARRTGQRPVVIHLSALLPTTRATHAARHGNAYTPADQLQWWNTSPNRINCHCTTQPVLVDSKGDVWARDQQKEIKEERAFFDE